MNKARALVVRLAQDVIDELTQEKNRLLLQNGFHPQTNGNGNGNAAPEVQEVQVRRKRRWWRTPDKLRTKVRRLDRRNVSKAAIAERYGIHVGTVARILAQA